MNEAADPPQTLAADELAAHREGAMRFCRPTLRHHCAGCGEPWPCLDALAFAEEKHQGARKLYEQCAEQRKDWHTQARAAEAELARERTRRERVEAALEPLVRPDKAGWCRECGGQAVGDSLPGYMQCCCDMRAARQALADPAGGDGQGSET